MIVPDWAGYLRFRPQIEEAIDTDLFPILWLDHQILRGVYRVWVGDSACIIAGIKEYPSGLRDVEGIVAAGDAQEIISSLIPQAEEWGRSKGCSGAIIESREGWERVLKPHGWQRFQVSIRRGL